MKWIILLSLWSLSVLAQTPLVFMRESAAGKHVILRQGSTETQLTAGKNQHLYPDISADGKWVVWVEGPNARDLTVVLYNTTTRGRERWNTGRRGPTLHPRFTKNGQQIFFSAPERGGNKIVSFAPANSRTRLLGRDADGTKVYRITPDVIPHEGQGFFPRPSNDGSFVLFQQNTFFKKEIVEHNTVTKQSRVLVDGLTPALSHDENWLVFSAKTQGSWDVWLMHRLTGDSVALTNDPKDELEPTFTSADNVAFAANRDGAFQIFQVVRGEWQQLVKSTSSDTAPMFAGETQWQQSLRTPVPSPARAAFSAVQHEGKIYVCCDKLQVYDPASGRWSDLAARPHAAHSFPLVASGQYLYAFGGAELTAIDRYDLETNTWLTIGTLARKPSAVSAVTIDSKVFLLADGQSTVEVFDLLTEKISKAPWSLPVRHSYSALEHNGQILLVGGMYQVTLIDPASGFTRELARLPFAISNPAVEVLGEDLLVFGGTLAGQLSSSVYALNLAKNSWRHTGRFLTEAKDSSQVVPFDGGLAILGGQSAAPVATFEVWKKME